MKTFDEYLLEHSKPTYGKEVKVLKLPYGVEVHVYHKQTPYDHLYKEEWNFLYLPGDNYFLRALSKKTMESALDIIQEVYTKKATNKTDLIDYLESLKNDRRLK